VRNALVVALAAVGSISFAGCATPNDFVEFWVVNTTDATLLAVTVENIDNGTQQNFLESISGGPVAVRAFVDLDDFQAAAGSVRFTVSFINSSGGTSNIGNDIAVAPGDIVAYALIENNQGDIALSVIDAVDLNEGPFKDLTGAALQALGN